MKHSEIYPFTVLLLIVEYLSNRIFRSINGINTIIQFRGGDIVRYQASKRLIGGNSFSRYGEEGGRVGQI